MEEIEIFRAHLLRRDASQSWGFQLQGGAEVKQPVKISKVASGSPAETTGLKVDDEVTEVNEVSTLHLTHSQVLEALRGQTGETLLLTIERRSDGSNPSSKETGYDVTDTVSVKESESIDRNASQDNIHPVGLHAELNKDGLDVVSSPVQLADTFSVGDHLETRRADTFSGRRENRVPVESHFVADRPTGPSNYPSHMIASGPLSYSPRPQRTLVEFQTAQSRPFVEPASRRHRRPNPTTVNSPTQAAISAPATRPVYQPPTPVETVPDFESLPSNFPNEYSTYFRDDVYPGEVPQSRTFRLLESVMSNEEPGAGVAALPPPKSAAMERMKHDGSFGSSPRVKVLMSQKYNSPLGMYSANNAIETFAAQAESALETLEKQLEPIGPENQPVFAASMHE